MLAANHLAARENAPTLKEIIRLTYAPVDIWCGSYRKPPKSVVLDIDDTVDVVHGHQKLALWHAHYNERCFLALAKAGVHVLRYRDGGRPVVVILRPGKTPPGVEERNLPRRLIGRIRKHWPGTRIAMRHAEGVRGTTRWPSRPARGHGLVR